jgi:hypothetical protein
LSTEPAPAKPSSKPLDALVFELVLADGTVVRRRAEDLQLLELEEQIAAATASGLPLPSASQV